MFFSTGRYHIREGSFFLPSFSVMPCFESSDSFFKIFRLSDHFAEAAAAGLTNDVSFLRHYNQPVTTLNLHLLRHYTSVPPPKKTSTFFGYMKVVELCCDALVNAQIQKTQLTNYKTNCPTKSCDQRVSSKPA